MIASQQNTGIVNVTRTIVFMLASILLALGPGVSAQTCETAGVGVKSWAPGDHEPGQAGPRRAISCGSERALPLDITVVDVARVEPSLVLDKAGVRVTVLSVPHADMPSVAYRVESAGTSVVFGSDQTGTNPKFVEFAEMPTCW